eukprot:12062885-Karenia_brevis.AAC.1
MVWTTTQTHFANLLDAWTTQFDPSADLATVKMMTFKPFPNAVLRNNLNAEFNIALPYGYGYAKFKQTTPSVSVNSSGNLLPLGIW